VLSLSEISVRRPKSSRGTIARIQSIEPKDVTDVTEPKLPFLIWARVRGQLLEMMRVLKMEMWIQLRMEIQDLRDRERLARKLLNSHSRRPLEALLMRIDYGQWGRKCEIRSLRTRY